MLRVGFVGLGKMGMLHLMNCRHIDNIRVVAAADRSKRALRKAKAFGATKFYTDYHDLFKNATDVDTVIVSVPNFLHFEVVQLALEAGLDVFIEKPLANTVQESREIVGMVKASGRKLMIGHVMRFYPVIKKMKEEVEKGSIGTLEVLTIEDVINGPFSHDVIPRPVPEWWFDPKKAGGGALIDLGYHLIDLFRFFVGEAKLKYSIINHKFNLPVEDGAIVLLQALNSSAKGIINVGWYLKTVFPRFNFRTILHGSAGYLSSDELIPRNLYLHAAKEGTKNLLRRLVGKKIHPLTYSYYYESYFKELNHFFDCLKQDLDPCVSAVDGLQTLKIIEEAYRMSKRSYKTECEEVD